MRLSQGSAATLGLITMNQLVEPTTCYLLLGNKCNSNCEYCAQKDSHNLSRIEWPEFDKVEAISRINKSSFRRVCLQCTDSAFEESVETAEKIEKPVSISYGFRNMKEVTKALFVADNISIALDCANEEIYERMRRGDFSSRLSLLKQSAQEFPGRITTHLIAGLGESEEEMTALFNELNESGIRIGLFAFTPINANQKQPDIRYYRRLQKELHKIQNLNNTPFQTTGCDDCNRPYYNENPRGPIYNYPRELTGEEYEDAIDVAQR